MSEFCLVYATFPDEREAFRIAEQALKEKLVACANINQKHTAIYWWNNGLENAEEVSVIFKTENKKYAELEQMIKKNHSFENPCIIMLDIKDGSKDFLNWIGTSLK